jgi:O-antigen/teichoic acid export membrane protein
LLFAAMVNLLDVAYIGGTQLLQALKKTRTQAVATVTAGTATVLLNLLLVRLWGATGLMVALVLGTALQAVFSNLLARRRLRQAAGETV